MRILILILFTSFALGCSNSTNEEPASEVIVKIGDDSITKEELTKALSKLTYQQRRIYTSSPEKFNEYLETRINEKVLYNEAYKRGIRDREDIQDLINNYERKLVAKTFGKELLEELGLTSDQINAHFEQNKEDYETINISQILIRYDSNDDDPKASALVKANEIWNKANSGESFEELATELSQDPISKNRGGKVGYINRGRYSEDIESVVFDLNEGEITKPFEVDGAYLIIKANAEAELPTYAEIERRIQSELVNQRLFDYITDLKQEWDVQVYDDRIEEIYNSESKQKEILPN